VASSLKWLCFLHQFCIFLHEAPNCHILGNRWSTSGSEFGRKLWLWHWLRLGVKFEVRQTGEGKIGSPRRFRDERMDDREEQTACAHRHQRRDLTDFGRFSSGRSILSLL
jgi:hypothetical protein